MLGGSKMGLEQILSLIFVRGTIISLRLEETAITLAQEKE